MPSLHFLELAKILRRVDSAHAQVLASAKISRRVVSPSVQVFWRLSKAVRRVAWEEAR